MSDNIFDNQVPINRCSAYIDQCKILDQHIATAEKKESIEGFLQEAHLRVKHILYELQILKIQISLDSKITEKQFSLLRNKFAKIIGIYQKLFVHKIPCSMQEVAKRIEIIPAKHEESWLKDIRMLGLALTLFSNYSQKSNSFLLVLNYQFQFTAILRNSILCKNLRPRLGADNRLCKLRREQINIFCTFTDDQINKQRTFYARMQSLASLENAIRMTRAMVELGIITNNEFCDAEYYKKQDEVFTKIMLDARESARK